jgi:hypothetical protein
MRKPEERKCLNPKKNESKMRSTRSKVGGNKQSGVSVQQRAENWRFEWKTTEPIFGGSDTKQFDWFNLSTLVEKNVNPKKHRMIKRVGQKKSHSHQKIKGLSL